MASMADQSYHMVSRHLGNEQDFSLYPDISTHIDAQQPYSAFNSVPDYDIDAQPQFTREMPYSTGFESNPMYVSSHQYGSPEMRTAPSNYSTASGRSANSSQMGSPHSIHDQIVPEWNTTGLQMAPGIVNYDNFGNGHEYNGYAAQGMDYDLTLEFNHPKPSYHVDPSILNPFAPRPASATHPHDAMFQAYPETPISQQSRSPHLNRGSQSPFPSTYSAYPYPQAGRRTSINSYGSDNFSSEESREKNRCTYADCGKTYKDLKAHMLTHQSERPEKCPIQTCDYHTKGFARKYDKNRHTLTHYKGTMVCGFCPGSGSATEKSFNRADVFKRHLTSVHAVEQTPPNSRKKTSGSNSGKKLDELSGYHPDATGKCSTCTGTFTNAQDFYEHLDDCVLRIVQLEEPSEAINETNLAGVENDSEVHNTLRNNQLPTSTQSGSPDEDEEEEEGDDSQDESFSLNSKSRKGRGNPKNGVQKSRGLTFSKGGMPLHTKSRKRRKDYPSSWGCPPEQMKMKKRVMCVFDGSRRLWKDDMMLDSDYEVRINLPGNERRYITDLDVHTMNRAQAIHGATDAEKGPWISDDLASVDDLEKLMEVKRED